MSRRRFLQSLMVAVLTACILGQPAVLNAQPGNGAELVPVLIGFRDTPGASQQALVRAYGGDIKYSYWLVPAIAASIPAQAVQALSANPSVVLIEPDIEVYAIGDPDYAGELNNTWGVKRIGAGEVHTNGGFGAGVKVAVIDSGVDGTHSDLVVAGGWDFVNKDDDPMDDNGHGTHVAGTVAAVRNGIGVVGAAPEAEIYALKVLGANGSGNYSDVIAALQWCVDNGIEVTNNSYGSSGDPGTLVKAAFDNSYAAGVLHVGAAGNSGNPAGKGDNVIYPARWGSVIAVAATGTNDKRASWSSTGPDVELSAPGVSINSTLKGGGYGTMSGTSMASPHVAGAAALVWATDPALTNDAVRLALASTAQDLGSAGRDNLYGYGLVRADSAVAAVTPVAPAIIVTVTTDKDSYVIGTATATVGVMVTDEHGEPIAGLDSSAFEAELDGTSVEITFDPMLGEPGCYTGSLDITELAEGHHTIQVTVTDGGLSGTDSFVFSIAPELEAGVIELTATAYKVKGLQKVDLIWTGATGTNVYLYRNGTEFTIPNTGSYTDNIDKKGGGSYTYKIVDETNTSSNEVTVTF